MKKKESPDEKQGAKERERLSLASEIGELVLAGSDPAGIKSEVKVFFEKTLELDQYALLILDRRNTEPMVVSEGISRLLLGEVMRAAFRGEAAGPFKENAVVIAGVMLFASDDIVGCLLLRSRKGSSSLPPMISPGWA